MKRVTIQTAAGQKHLLPKFSQSADLIRQYDAKSVLDVGCRDCILRDALRHYGLDSVRYAGADLFQNAAGTVDYVCDLVQGVPVAAGSYEVVTALDVLEHLDDLQAGLDELNRIASRLIIVILPNMAHFSYRFRLLLRGRLNNKYDLKYGYGADRHRWFTVYGQTTAYMQTYCAEHGYRLNVLESSLGRPRMMALERLFKLLRFAPDWYVWSALYVIEKPPAP